MLLREQSVPHHRGRIHCRERQLGRSVRREPQADWPSRSSSGQAAETSSLLKYFSKSQDQLSLFLHVFSLYMHFFHFLPAGGRNRSTCNESGQSMSSMSHALWRYLLHLSCRRRPQSLRFSKTLHFRWFFAFLENECCQTQRHKPKSHCHLVIRMTMWFAFQVRTPLQKE